MKALLTAIALVIASPVAAQTAGTDPHGAHAGYTPATAPADHSSHSAHSSHSNAGHAAVDHSMHDGCCEKQADGKAMPCCDKAQGAAQKDCCEKAAAARPASKAHAGHGAHQH